MSSDFPVVSRRNFMKSSATAGAAFVLAPSTALSCGSEPNDRASQTAATTYTLDIQFTGLCLFVLSGGLLHVLLPNPHLTGDHEHVIRLYSDGWAANGEPVQGGFEANVLTQEKDPVLDFRDGLVDFTSIWNKKVKGALLSDAIDPSILAGHVRIPGGYLSHTSPWRGVWSSSDGHPDMTLAPYGTWTTQVEIAVLNPFHFSTGAVTLPPIALTPGRNARIEVRHAPMSEQGPNPADATEPAQGAKSLHFGAYSQLFEQTISTELRWRQQLGTKPRALEKRGISPFTCMIGGGGG